MIPNEENIGGDAAVVIGGSAGGLDALSRIFSALTTGFAVPILIVQHLHYSDEGRFSKHLAEIAPLPVIEPCDKEPIEPGHIYIAPANYHMAVERDRTVSLSVDEKVNWSRPCIDVLFESAASIWGEHLLAVILSGANFDGSKGMLAVKKNGGLLVAQDPKTAESSAMPRAAIDAARITNVFEPLEIGRFLVRFDNDVHGKMHRKSSDEGVRI